MASSPVGRILSGIDKPLPEGLSELVEIAKILIVSAPLSGQEGVEAMVKIVVPLGVQSIPSFGGRVDHAYIVEIAFRHDDDRTP